ncbi:hypothetical protein QJS66_17830 [Kocuria rhizophila]|nr:hypothetical protein QJS66_17830 [Kocuria rhizophila]
MSSRRPRAWTAPPRGSASCRVVLPNMKAAIMVAVVFRAGRIRIFDNVFVMTQGRSGARDALAARVARPSVVWKSAWVRPSPGDPVRVRDGSSRCVAIKIFKVDLTGGSGKGK